MPIRRRSTASCWAGYRRVWDRPRRTSPPSRWCARCGFRRTTDAGRSEPMGLFEQPVKVPQRAEQRIDVAIVGDVVAEILHRRGEERRQPDGIDPKVGHVVEPFGDADEVANAVAVVILKRTRIDLIDDRAAPPILVDDGRLGRRLGFGHQRRRGQPEPPPLAAIVSFSHALGRRGSRRFAKTFK
jgi:hypothetical protein